MADEQIIVDIQVDSKEVGTAKIRFDELTDSIEKLEQEIKSAKKENAAFRKSQEQLEKDVRSGTISHKEYKDGIKNTSEQIKINNKIISKSTDELSKQRIERKANIRLINSEKDSLKRLEAEASLLNQQISKQTRATKEGREEYDRLEKELGEVNKKVNEQRQAFNDNTKNIGNYKNSIIGAAKELRKQEVELRKNLKALNQAEKGINKTEQEQKQLALEIDSTQTQLVQVNKELKKYGENLDITDAEIIDITDNQEGFNKSLDKLPDSTESATGGVESLSKSFKALLANPVVLIISLIVASLAALFGAFKKSENGAKLLEKAGAGLNGLMMILTKVMNVLAGALTKAFEDPKQAVEDLWEAIKKNLVNRIEGVVRLFKALASIDFKDLTGSAKELGGALIQIGTGMDEEQQKAFTDGLKDMAKEAAILAQKMADLAASQRAMNAQARTLQKDIAVLNAEFEKLGEIAGDDTRNMEEMRQAAIDAGAAAAELAQKQEKLAQIRLNTINQEVAIRRSAGEDIQGLLDQQAEAEVTLTEARSQAAIAQQKILIEQRKIERDLFEQNLDILLDVGDRIKTEQEKVIQNESLSLDKRKQLLEASKAALTSNFDAIKKEYELYGITAEQINDVINASDAKQANEKLKALGLNEIANNRLREIILERKQAELDFNDLSKDLSDEEVERKKAANETIQEINEESALSEIQNAEDLKDKLIELEKAKLKIILEDETLLAEEREALTLESEERIQEIENEFSEVKKEKEGEDLEERKELLEEFFSDIIQITGQFAGEEIAVFGKIAAGIAKAFEDGKLTAENALAGINIVSNAVFDNIAARRNEDLAGNEAARQKELELAEGNAQAQDNINLFYDKKSAELKRKQFNADKAKALIDISIATAVGAVKALPNLILAGIVTGFGITQGVLVATKKAPKFGKGTSDIVGIGDSHASGNDTDVWGFSGGQKQYFGKVEKGEAMPVIRKSAANDYMIAKLNGRFSSRGGKFADGTPDITEQGQAQNNEVFMNNLVDAFSNINIVAKIEDITKEARKKIEIVDNSKV